MGYKAARLGIEYTMNVGIYSGGPAQGTKFETKHRVWMLPIGNVEPGMEFGDISVQARNGSVVNLDDAVNEYFDQGVQRNYRTIAGLPFMEPGDVIVRWYPENSDVGLFIATGGITSWTAVGGGSNTFATQAIFTFRTQRGGHARIIYNHCNATIGRPIKMSPTAPGMAGYMNNLLTAASSCIRGIDGSPLISGINLLAGQNEALWKSYFRS